MELVNVLLATIPKKYNLISCVPKAQQWQITATVRKICSERTSFQGETPKKEEIVLASNVELEGPVELPRHYELPIGGRLPDYPVERHISPEMAKYFDLRYCVEGKHAYVDPYTEEFADNKRVKVNSDGNFVNDVSGKKYLSDRDTH